MQEFTKKKVALVSLLKPVDEPRMFDKMGRSLAKHFDIHILGYPTQRSFEPESGVTFHQSRKFSRIGLSRLLQPFRWLMLLLRLKPQTIIICTHELLVMSFVLKLLIGCKVCYDVQENYYRNILYSKVYPFLVKTILAWYVRSKEYLCSPFIDQFFLAETCYQSELHFARRRFIVLENKFRRVPGMAKSTISNTQIIFSGTLAESTGVLNAISLVKKLHSKNKDIKLLIIGYSGSGSFLVQLKALISNTDYISLVGGDKLVPHVDILLAINASKIGLISYELSPITQNRMPTKLFEYLACGIPMIINDHKPWLDQCPPGAAIGIDLKNPDVQAIDTFIRNAKPYASPDSIFWDGEADLLLNALR